MKEIKFDGAEVKCNLTGKIPGSGAFSISRINAQGMLFETTLRLSINSSYKFQITAGAKKMTITARVADVLLKSAVRENRKTENLYQVAVEFEDLKDEEKAFLDEVMEQVLESNVPRIEDLDSEIRGAKFRAR